VWGWRGGCASGIGVVRQTGWEVYEEGNGRGPPHAAEWLGA